MDETKLYMNRLILGVTHLCTRTRELAESGAPEPIRLMPIRECLDMLARTVDELGCALDAAGRDVEEPRAALPAAKAARPEASWLVGPEDA